MNKLSKEELNPELNAEVNPDQMVLPREPSLDDNKDMPFDGSFINDGFESDYSDAK